MYLLYVDESGNPDEPSDRHFVLAGVALHERKTYYVGREIDAIQTKHFPNIQPIEFHTSPIRAGRDFWRNIEVAKRQEVLKDLSLVISRATGAGFVLFGAVIEKDASVYGESAVRLATEEICNRFDLFLKRLYQDRHDKQRGLLVFSEGQYKTRSKVWVREFRDLGTKWGTLSNLSDIPYFASSNETRLLQHADFVSNALFIAYERGDTEFAKALIPRIDTKDGVIHGLVHRTQSRATCGCPACASRRTPGNSGAW